VIAVPFVGIGRDSGPAGPLADPVPTQSLTTERPAGVVIARADAVELMLPITMERVTAFVFRAVDSPEARELSPNEQIDYHVADIEGASGPDKAGVDVGAPAGTPVYAPIDGTITSVSDYAVAGRIEGYELLIEPTRGASVSVRVSQLSPEDGITRPTIGSRVSAGRDVIGRVHDLAEVAALPVGRFTADAGNSVHLEVVATGSIPIS
jgi:hypothetical protein